MSAVALALLVAPSVAGAATTHDVRGEWDLTCALCGPQTHIFDTQDADGNITGHNGLTNGPTWTITGKVTGDQIVFTVSYTGGGYSSMSTGTINAGTTFISGTFNDTAGHTNLAFQMHRLSGPPGGGRPTPQPTPTTPAPTITPAPLSTCIASLADCGGLGVAVGSPTLTPLKLGPFVFGCVDRSGKRAQTNCTYTTAIEYPEAEYILLTRGSANALGRPIFTDPKARLVRVGGTPAAKRTKLLVLAKKKVVVPAGQTRKVSLKLTKKARRLFRALRARKVRVRRRTRARLRVSLNGSAVKTKKIRLKVR